MSIEEGKFDDLLKSKLSETLFEFNEANWDKAEALIIKSDKKRKRRRIGIIFFIGLILGVCLMIPFIGNEENIGKTNLNKHNGNKAEIKLENATKKVDTGTNTTIQKENYMLTNSINEKELHNNDIQKNQITMWPNGSLDSKKEENSNICSKVTESNTVKGAIFSNAKNHKTDKLMSRKEVGNSTKKYENINRNETVSTADRTHNILETIAITENNQSISQKTDTILVPVKSIKITKADSIVIDADSIAKTKIDSVQQVVTKETNEEIKKESLRQNTVFSIDAGANYSLGWKNSNTKEAAGFNGVFGFSMSYYFNQKWNLLIGIQYNSLANLSYSSYISSNSQYDFGFNRTNTTITPKMLYYISIPVKLQYNFNNKNGISIGMNILYLLNTKSKVDTYTQTTFETTNHITTTKTGYMDGFAGWDMQPALAYRRRIYKKFDLRAETYYGLIDIKNNLIFGINRSEHNCGVKLTLSYNFIK